MKLQFEEWAKGQGINLDTYNGHYVSKVAQGFWECWQAATASK